jgi:hypothetical protein
MFQRMNQQNIFALAYIFYENYTNNSQLKIHFLKHLIMTLNKDYRYFERRYQNLKQ